MQLFIAQNLYKCRYSGGKPSPVDFDTRRILVFTVFYDYFFSDLFANGSEWIELLFLFQVGKKFLSPNGEPITFVNRVALAAIAGFSGGIVGTPGDMINVRMQNDIKLPPEQRRK